MLGFTIVFSAYGAGVGWAGSLLNDYRRSLELIGGFLMIVMGLALIGFALAGVRTRVRACTGSPAGRRSPARC